MSVPSDNGPFSVSTKAIWPTCMLKFCLFAITGLANNMEKASAIVLSWMPDTRAFPTAMSRARHAETVLTTNVPSAVINGQSRSTRSEVEHM